MFRQTFTRHFAAMRNLRGSSTAGCPRCGRACTCMSSVASTRVATMARGLFASSRNFLDKAGNPSGAANVLVLFYSTYGHNYKMAQAAIEGAKEGGAKADLKRIPETLPDDILAKMGALDAKKQWEDVPVAVVDDLPEYDAVIWCTPTRFGSIPAQVKSFMDATGGLWYGGKLVGKVGSVMASSNTQHGGNEMTIHAMHTVLLHHGNVLVGLPYTFQGQGGVEAVKGGSPYGATTVCGNSGERMPGDDDLAGARFQGKHVASIAAKLSA